MKRLQIPQKLVHEKIYVDEIAAINLSKIYLLKNARKTSKPNNHDLNRDWISEVGKIVRLLLLSQATNAESDEIFSVLKCVKA